MSRRKDAISLTSLILIIVIVIPLILSALRIFVEAGVFQNLWYDMVDLLPFGGAIAQLAIKIYTTIIPQALDIQNYTAQIQPISGVLEFLEEFGKLCVAGVCYKAISFAGDKAMENSESKGILVFLRKVVWHLASAFLGCVASGVVLHILFENIQAAAGNSQYPDDFSHFGRRSGNTLVYYWIFQCISMYRVYPGEDFSHECMYCFCIRSIYVFYYAEPCGRHLVPGNRRNGGLGSYPGSSGGD